MEHVDDRRVRDTKRVLEHQANRNAYNNGSVGSRERPAESRKQQYNGASFSRGQQRRLVEEEEEDEEEEEEGDDDDMLMSEDNENEENEGNQEDELEQSGPHLPPPEAVPGKGKQSPRRPSLKIKLKFSGVSGSEHSTTPGDETPGRSERKKSKAGSQGSDYDSEESMSRSTSVVPPARMTQRQAARAGVFESAELLVWEEPESKKKKHLTEVELALRREETARKRKNLTEKKLEDEKTQTINRLLKRQSRPRGKKARVADPDEDGDENEDDATAESTPAPPPIPTMFRWISTSKQDFPALSFSVPPSLLQPENATPKTTVLPPAPMQRPLCDYTGCGQPRKYKLVKDPTRGGCGMEHLKALQTASA